MEKKNQKGFSLIELLIVIAIIAILAAIAIPAYQNYTTRSKITEGISLASTAKIAVAEYMMTRGGALPTTNEETEENGALKLGLFRAALSFKHSPDVVFSATDFKQAKSPSSSS